MEGELPHIVVGEHSDVVMKLADTLRKLMVENPDGGIMALHPNFWYVDKDIEHAAKVDIKITYIPVDGDYVVDIPNNRIHFNENNESHVLTYPETITAYDAEEYNYEIKTGASVDDIAQVLNIGLCILKQMCPDIRCIQGNEQYYVSETHIFHLTIQ